ncbi:MAG: hypothetical protein AB7P08_09785 [Burkholderiales bacterium]
MDWLTFTSKIIEALAWPIVVLILGLVFREKLHDLLAAVRKLKAGPVEAEFEMAAKQARANAAEASAIEATKTQESSPGSQETSEQKVVEKLLNARSDPAGTILVGWATVDGELFRLGRQMGLLVDPLENTAKVYQAVISSNVLPAGTVRLVKELRELRNSVAHVKVTPTPDSAQDYLLAVDRVVALIRNYRKNLPNYASSNG